MAVRLGVSSPLVEHPRFPAIGSIGYWIHHTHTSPRSQTAWKMHVMFAVALSFFFFSPSCPESPISISIPCIMKSCQNMPHPGHWLWTDSWIVSQSRKWLAAHTHTHHTYHLHTYTPPWNWNPILSRIGMVGGSPVSILHFSLDSNSNSCTVASIDLTWIKGQNLDRGDPVKVYAVHPEYGTSPILLWDRSFGLTRVLSPWTG